MFHNKIIIPWNIKQIYPIDSQYWPSYKFIQKIDYAQHRVSLFNISEDDDPDIKHGRLKCHVYWH